MTPQTALDCGGSRGHINALGSPLPLGLLGSVRIMGMSVWVQEAAWVKVQKELLQCGHLPRR